MIVIPYKIKNNFIVEHRELIFLYSLDYLRKGGFSQSIVCYGEPNCFPICTLYKYCANPVYFQDNHSTLEMIDSFLKDIPLDGRDIIPFRKIGEGCSRMSELAPKAFAYLKEHINKIASKNYTIDYTQEY